MTQALLLENAAAYVDLTSTVQPGDLKKPDEPIELESFDKVVSETMAKFPAGDTTQDAYLAPKLHSAFRISGRMAGDRRLWSWLAIAHRSDYVQHRWGTKGSAAAPRYLGSLNRNTFARLWWIADMTIESGTSDPYRLTKIAFSSQEFTVALFDRSFMQFRPAMVACLEALQGQSGDVAQRFGLQLNAVLGALVLESLDKDRAAVLIKQLVQESKP
jgi:hypothetical protein